VGLRAALLQNRVGGDRIQRGVERGARHEQEAQRRPLGHFQARRAAREAPARDVRLVDLPQRPVLHFLLVERHARGDRDREQIQGLRVLDLVAREEAPVEQRGRAGQRQVLRVHAPS